MKFDINRMFNGKREMRRRLANQSVAVKLQMLDVLRERELAIRARTRIAPVKGSGSNRSQG